MSRPVHVPRKVTVQPVVTLRAYPILADALDTALQAGIRKLFKYAPEKVDEQYVLDHLDTVSNYLTNALCEILDFGDD